MEEIKPLTQAERNELRVEALKRKMGRNLLTAPGNRKPWDRGPSVLARHGFGVGYQTSNFHKGITK